MIEHLKSGLSISTHVGCTMSCPYCVLSKLSGFEDGPQHSKRAEEILEELLSGRALFKNGKTPLIINNRTDPFIASVVDSTYHLLELLAGAEIISPILLISKFPPPPTISHLFKKLRLIYIYSYSNLSNDFNYLRLDEDLQQIIQVVPERSRYHYFRPIIPNSNDNLNSIFNCLYQFAYYKFQGSIITGLRVTEKNINLLPQNTKYDAQHKYIEKGLFSTILDEARKREFQYPIYRHTSCAIATFLQNGCSLRYYGRYDHCNTECTNARICMHHQEVKKDYKELKDDLATRYGPNFSVELDENTETLIINSECSQEDTAYIKNAFAIKVDARNLILAPSEREILSYE